MSEMNTNMIEANKSVQADTVAEKERKKIDFSDRKTKKLIKKIIIWTVVIAVLMIGYFMLQNALAPKGDASNKVSTSMALRGDIDVTITGSGVVEAMEKYDIVPMVKGEILAADFEEGAIVEKDSVLYVFDNSDAQINIEKAQNAITRADISNRNNVQTLADWVTKAPIDGYISSLDIKVGDSVNTNTVVCTITNDDIISVTIPFSASYINDIYVGASAQLTSAEYMTNNIFGTVNDIDRTPIRSGSGDVLYNVEIILDNPGAISEGVNFTANVNGCISAASGVSEVYEKETVVTKASGDVVRVNYKNGDKVSAGDAIIEVTNQSTLDNITKSDIEYADLQLSLQQQYEALENYTIKSPITGKVITKNYKAGDTVDNGNSSVNLAVVADMSKMKFTMDVDELDISKIQLGQSVEVVADALEENTFVGQITNIIQEGESMNGVTVYPVEVVIDEPEGLMIGMNVTATVIVESKTDVLKVPVDAVTKQGGKSYVMKLKDEKMPERAQLPQGERPQVSKREQTGENDTRQGETPQMSEGQMPVGGARGESTDGENPGASGERRERVSAAMPQMNVAVGNQSYTLEDFERVEVETGINSEDEIEIISGLDEGDIVRITTSSSSTNTMMPMMGGMGGMPGGGMPGGAMPGGNRGGNMGGSRVGR